MHVVSVNSLLCIYKSSKPNSLYQQYISNKVSSGLSARVSRKPHVRLFAPSCSFTTSFHSRIMSIYVHADVNSHVISRSPVSVRGGWLCLKSLCTPLQCHCLATNIQRVICYTTTKALPSMSSLALIGVIATALQSTLNNGLATKHKKECRQVREEGRLRQVCYLA